MTAPAAVRGPGRPREVSIRTAAAMRRERRGGDTLATIATRWGYSIPTVVRYTREV